jgi:hypothetical protein
MHGSGPQPNVKWLVSAALTANLALGKGEADSSILSSSTAPGKIPHRQCLPNGKPNDST